jgi:hypothetical protein
MALRRFNFLNLSRELFLNIGRNKMLRKLDALLKGNPKSFIHNGFTLIAGYQIIDIKAFSQNLEILRLKVTE